MFNRSNHSKADLGDLVLNLHEDKEGREQLQHHKRAGKGKYDETCPAGGLAGNPLKVRTIEVPFSRRVP